MTRKDLYTIQHMEEPDDISIVQEAIKVLEKPKPKRKRVKRIERALYKPLKPGKKK